MRKRINKSVLAIVSVVLLASLFLGCGKNDEPAVQGSTVTDTRQLVLDGSHALSKAQQTTMTNQNNEFAFRLFEAVSQSPDLKGKSVAVSPVSVTFALGMVANGGNEQTVSELTHVLGFDDGPAEGGLDECLNDLNAFCLSQMQQAATIDPSVTLHYANAVCPQESYGIYPPFEQAMNRYYQADIFPLDYTTEEAFLKLNDWASKKTEGMIDPLFEKPYPQQIDDVVLMNAICLKAPWNTPFDKQKTVEGDFTREDGTTTKVPFMVRIDTLHYASTERFSAVRLYYGQQQRFCFTLLLPKEGHTVAEVAKNLDMETWNQTIASMWKTTMKCSIPRFSTAEEIDLSKILAHMGAPTMFTDAALPYLLDHGKSTNVADVFQKVRIDVDETGTEGAAVTVVYLPRGGSVSLRADHPFVYVISDDITDTIYFIGTYRGE